MSQIHAWVVDQHDFAETLAAIATCFAAFVPLPVYVISTIRKRYADRREKAFALIEKIYSDEMRYARDRTLNLLLKDGSISAESFNGFNEETKSIVRKLMNENEIIGLHLNTSRVERDIFYRAWRTAYINEWDAMKPLILHLRIYLGKNLYREWEKAAERARTVKVR